MRNEHAAIFLSLNDQGGRYLEASDMPGGRGGGIGRHRAGYLGTERGTITNINIRRPRSLWWHGGEPFRCQESRVPCSIRLARAKRNVSTYPLPLPPPSSTVPFLRFYADRLRVSPRIKIATNRGRGRGGCNEVDDTLNKIKYQVFRCSLLSILSGFCRSIGRL